MKRILAVMLFAALVGCTSRTEFGPCIGAFDDRDPMLTYKVSILNTVLAILFVETVIVPVWAVVDGALCPIGKKS